MYAQCKSVAYSDGNIQHCANAKYNAGNTQQSSYTALMNAPMMLPSSSKQQFASVQATEGLNVKITEVLNERTPIFAINNSLQCC